MAPKKARKRDRTVRREAARVAQKLGMARDKLFSLQAGGKPERPLEVPSASAVEPAARKTPCPRCGGELRVEEHAAEVLGGVRLREVRVRCVACGSPRSIWFRVIPQKPS